MTRVSRIICQLAAVAVAAAAVSGQAPQADWPQWRGPGRDAAARSFTPPARWPEQLAQLWKVDVGLGYATPLVVGTRVYVFARQGDNESMTALDATDGAVIWRTIYPVSFTMHSGAAQHGPGPKSTPAFADGKLFSIGMTGIVTAFDAALGRMLWQRPASAVMTTFTTHSFAPIVDRGVVIFHVGGHDQGAVTAFDVNTGDVKWRWASDGPSYGSPVISEIAGTRQLITLTQRKLIGLDPATGALLWERPYTTPSTTNAQTPVVFENMVILGDEGTPLQAFAISFTTADGQRRWSATVAWENAGTPTRLSNSLLAGETVFGLSTRNSGQYFAVDARTGQTLWKSAPRQARQAAIVHAGDLLFSLESDGELVVIRAHRTAFEPIQRYKVAEADTWTPPVIAGDRVFVKDVTTLALWTWTGAASATVSSAPPQRRRPSAPAPAPAADRPITWAAIPAGRFQMGCAPHDALCGDTEKPRHEVMVAPFQMMTTDVTVGMYRAYAAKAGKPMLDQPEWNDRDDHPVVNVSWNDSVAFCAAMDARLPSEAEWEYAARGERSNTIFAWGNVTTPIVNGRKVANVADESARRQNPGLTDYFADYDDGFVETAPVASFPANSYGLYDVIGNVWRWTSTLEKPYPYRADDGREDLNAPGLRVLRGGSYWTPPQGFRLSYRVMDDPRDEDDWHSFRCAR